MKPYKKVVISHMVILIISLIIVLTASGITSKNYIGFLGFDYLIFMFGAVIIAISASIMRKIIDDLIPKEKR